MTSSVTIATHNGSSIAREHNRRNRKITNKENHIDQDGWHEVWHDETERAAYHRLFDGAVKRYNDKQTRSDRHIKNYYKSVAEDAKKHTAYEIIVGVYGKQDDKIDPETSRAILHKYFAEWQQRNPNLELIGAYFHADEPGGQPHVHIDYIPVAHGYTRGMDTQTAIDRALREQGFQCKGKLTPQIAWERSENEALESICRSHGLDVEHPQRGSNIEHLRKDLYVATKQRDEALKQLKEITERIDNLSRTKEISHKKTLNRQNVVISADDYEDICIALQRAETVQSLDDREAAVRVREAAAEQIEADARKRADEIIRCAEFDQQMQIAKFRNEIDRLKASEIDFKREIELRDRFIQERGLKREYEQNTQREREVRHHIQRRKRFDYVHTADIEL